MAFATAAAIAATGLRHLYRFQGRRPGRRRTRRGGRASVLAAKRGEKLPIRVSAAALLDEKPRDDIRSRQLDQKPYWHVERARIGDTRTGAGRADRQRAGRSRCAEIDADGKRQDVKFEYTPKAIELGGVAVFPAAHTNPVFVEVDGKPIRASRRSAPVVPRCGRCLLEAKAAQTREPEHAAAAAAYEVARQAYRKVLTEAVAE